MATKKVTQLTTATSAVDADLVMIVDVDDTTMSADGTNKKITKANLLTGIGGGILTQTSNTVANAAVLTMKYDDTPITLVGATAGKIHIPVSVTIVSVGAGASESSSDDLRMGWNASGSAAADYLMSSRDYMQGISSGTYTYNMCPAMTAFTNSYPATAANTPLQLWCNGDFNGGWSMTVYTTYYSITV